MNRHTGEEMSTGTDTEDQAGKQKSSETDADEGRVKVDAKDQASKKELEPHTDRKWGPGNLLPTEFWYEYVQE